MGFDVNFSLVFCGFLSMVVVGVLLPWIYRGGFFFDIYIYIYILCCCCGGLFDFLCCCCGGGGLFDFLCFCGFLVGGDGFFSAGSGGFLVTEVVVMGG